MPGKPACADYGQCQRTIISTAVLIFYHEILDDRSQHATLILVSSTQSNSGAIMTDPIDDILLDWPLQPKSAAGRYDRLQEAGMATRFVKAHREILADVPGSGPLG